VVSSSLPYAETNYQAIQPKLVFGQPGTHNQQEKGFVVQQANTIPLPVSAQPIQRQTEEDESLQNSRSLLSQ